jgi:flagellar biosynthesis protein FlhG
MIAINKLAAREHDQVRVACAYLFSPALARQDDFMGNLQLPQVDDAFREKEKRYNPYLHLHESREMLARRADRLEKIKASYRLLKTYLTPQPDGGRETRSPFIIAVGGAKGGVGKSLLSVNLGILMASRGRHTVLVDLDLGGSNLHFYLGERSLEWDISDFFNRKATALNEIVIPTRYGLGLIGGGKAELGAANIHFARKLKLLKAIKNLKADCVVIDLGGDTSYNSIDFFLLAHAGIVVTSCEPASYVGAYNFIKVALQRKLSRLCGAESEYRKSADPDLKRLIDETVLAGNREGGNFSEALLARLQMERPHATKLIETVLTTFQPQVVVNMIDASTNAGAVVERIQKVARNMLAIKVGHLGNLPFQPEVKNSALDLVPSLIKYPDGEFAQALQNLYYQLIG